MDSITLKLDTTKFDSAIAELKQLMFRKGFAEIIKRTFGSFDALLKLFCFKQQPTVGATLPILLEPTDRLLDFLLASRTNNREGGVVE